MLQVKCYFCKEELLKQGGLLFSPPVVSSCVKLHICAKCWDELIVPKKQESQWTKILNRIKSL